MKISLLAFMLLICSFLCSCSQAAQVEDQAYILVMGLDRTDSGQIEMTVLIPQISGGSGAQEGGGSKSSYKHFSIEADSYEAALEKLSWAATRDPELAQMKLIVLSRKLAEEDLCKEILENMAQTERLYTATKIAVCEGSAKDFVEAMKPNIGTRISSDIDALFEHYCAEGYLPSASLADLYYHTESIYSDPMAAFALLEDKQKAESENNTNEPAKAASALRGTARELSAEFQSDNPVRYVGSAVFKDGSMRGTFNLHQTMIANLLRNQIESMRYECEGQSLLLIPTRSVRLKVDTKSMPIRILIDAQLSIAAQEEKPDENKLRRQLENDIRNTIQAAQNMSAEPFGFAEKASVHFLTFDRWKAFNWREQFRNAEIDIKLKFAYSDT